MTERLNLSVGSGDGDFSPYIKYNAKAGRFYVKAEDGSGEVEVVNPRLVFDLEHIKTGWIYYEEGSGPEKVWDSSRAQAAPKPAGPRKFKRGFEVMVFGPDVAPGAGKVGLREFSSTATNCIAAILDMWGAYQAAAKTNAGKLPFFKCEGVAPISGKYGTNYEPKFKLIGWVERAKVPEFDAARSEPEPGATEPSDWQAPNPPPHPGTERPEDRLDDPMPF